MRRIFKNIWLILSLDCEQSAWLTSESFDRTLTVSERWAVRLHNAYCKKSRSLARQLQLLDQALRNSPDHIPFEEISPRLTPQAKRRIAEKLEDI